MTIWWGSPSSRRAWIEIPSGRKGKGTGYQVALLAEGVDRNNTEQPKIYMFNSRPPRGGRG